MELIVIDPAELRNTLVEQQKPIMEHKLIKKIHQLANLSPSKNRLYIQHFSLYHALYKLKQDAGNDHLYLHLDPMLIRLVKIPSESQCRHYNDREGSFCKRTTKNRMYCMQHINSTPEGPDEIFFDPLFDFYTDPRNITFGDSKILYQLMEGIKTFAFNKQEIDKALKIFDITKPCKKNIQTRYYHLARLYHPDSKYGTERKMKEINHAYTVLQKVFIL